MIFDAGVSEEVLALADGCALVPMLGFVDSYNVSVAAALTLYEARAGPRAILCHDRQRLRPRGLSSSLSVTLTLGPSLSRTVSRR